MPGTGHDMTRTVGLLAVLVLLTLGGCSSQELYGTGQAWQRQECSKLMDSQERSRCMASASRSYDDYKREVEAGKAGK